MLYVKEDNLYVKYYVRADGKFICNEKNDERIVLYDISNEFDAVVDEDGDVHFILQSLSGELIYLKKENTVWRKYNILKSKNNLRKISGLRLICSDGMLCAFYVMEYLGKNMLIKHIFNDRYLFREPEVIDLTDERKNFCICHDVKNNAHIFWKSEKSGIKSFSLDNEFNVKTSAIYTSDDDIFAIKAVYIEENLYFVYTASKNSGTVIKFCSANDLNSGKIITFGVSRNCVPEILMDDNLLFIQWNEGESIIRTEANTDDFVFSKPKMLKTSGIMAKIRQRDNSTICDKCGVYGGVPYIKNINIKYSEGEKTSMNNKADIINDKYSKSILSKLKEIETDIDLIGKSLNDICGFLDKLKDFRYDADINEISITNTQNYIPIVNDVGNINEENMNIFKNTDIDKVLPDNAVIRENAQ